MILSQTVGIKIPEKDENQIIEVIKKITKDIYNPIRFFTNYYDEDIVKEMLHAQELYLILRKKLQMTDISSLSNKSFSPVIFKLDNDNSVQIDFINITAKLRGLNYGIEEVNIILK